MDQIESVEGIAKTVEEAIEIGLRQLGVDRDKAEIEIVSKGKAGILGFGSEPARVRVSLLKDIPEDAIIAKTIVDQLLGYLDVDLVADFHNFHNFWSFHNFHNFGMSKLWKIIGTCKT